LRLIEPLLKSVRVFIDWIVQRFSISGANK